MQQPRTRLPAACTANDIPQRKKVHRLQSIPHYIADLKRLCFYSSRSLALALLVFGTMSIAAAGQKQPSFEVVVIKPSKPGNSHHGWDSSIDRVSIQNYSLRRIIRAAYGLKSDSQVVGGPKWLDNQPFDILAKVDDSEVTKIRSMGHGDSESEYKLMLQSLLADRFQVKVSRAVRTIPVYALVAARSRPKLASSSPLTETDKQDPHASSEPKAHSHSISAHNGQMTANAISMDAFADYLTGIPETGNRVVLNRTGLAGDYDFNLNWTQDRGQGIPADASYPGLFTALQEELGLKLKSQKGSVEVIVVDVAAKPVLD
jgi:uncharacterized protein (TIGR03435 family)